MRKFGKEAEQRRRALESMIHVKHKRDNSKKARLCADGRKQCLTMNKDESASPTVCTNSVFITAAVEAAERRRTTKYNSKHSKTAFWRSASRVPKMPCFPLVFPLAFSPAPKIQNTLKNHKHHEITVYPTMMNLVVHF